MLRKQEKIVVPRGEFDEAIASFLDGDAQLERINLRVGYVELMVNVPLAPPEDEVVILPAKRGKVEAIKPKTENPPVKTPELRVAPPAPESGLAPNKDD